MAQAWIDPFSMNLDDKQHDEDFNVNMAIRSLKPAIEACRATSETCNCNADNYAFSYYKRLVNMILKTLDLDPDTSDYTSKINIKIPGNDYNTLKSFLNNPNANTETFQKVDAVLQSVYSKSSKSTLEKMGEMALSWQEYVHLTLTLRTIGIVVGSVFVMVMCVKLYRAKVTIWSVVKYLVFLAWIVDFGFTWMHLYQIAEVNKMVDMHKLKSIPDHCDPSKLSVLQNIWQFLSGSDECQKYHQAMFKDIFWGIGPFTVISAQFKTPASNIGSAFGGLIWGMQESLPWGVNIIFLPVFFIFFCIIFCLVLSFVTDTNFELNLFHMLKFKFHNDDRRALGNVFNGLLDNVAHRRIVEEVQMLSNNQSNPMIHSHPANQSIANQSTTSAVENPQSAIGPWNAVEFNRDIQTFNEGPDDKEQGNMQQGNKEDKKNVVSETKMKVDERLKNQDENTKKKDENTTKKDENPEEKDENTKQKVENTTKKEVETMTWDTEEALRNKIESVNVGVQTSYVRPRITSKSEIEELPA